MKYIYKILLLSFIIIGFNSCDENENFEILPKQETLEIVAPTSGSVVILSDANLDNKALFISWKSTSNNATYDIEVAETGTDFENPILLATTESTNFSMTVGELNTFLLDTMGLNPEEATSLDFRVLSNGEISQTVSVIFTPYKVEYTEFYLVGSLTGWDPATSLPMTNVDLNIFEITVDLVDGDEFKFLPTNTGWDGDFGEDPDNAGTLIEEGEQNITGYAAGKYKITADLNTFTFTVEEVLAPNELFLVGSINGWDNASALPFTLSSENVFTIAVELAEGDEFKFLPTLGSWDGDWGADPNNEGKIIQEGEQNVSGYAAGSYLITVDYNTLTFSLSSIDNLYLVGSLTGWDPATSLEMFNPDANDGKVIAGSYALVTDLPDGAEFKFLPTNTGWDGDWGKDPSNEGSIIQEGEENVSGYEAGKYVISVNFNSLVYNVSAINEIPTSLYLVGSFNGWSNDTDNPEFTETSTGVFTITQALDADAEFKFVPVAGSWDNDFGENQNVPGVIEQNSEKNYKVTQAGTYIITLDFNKGTVSVTNS